jgi:hypothetical protein
VNEKVDIKKILRERRSWTASLLKLYNIEVRSGVLAVKSLVVASGKKSR